MFRHFWRTGAIIAVVSAGFGVVAMPGPFNLQTLTLSPVQATKTVVLSKKAADGKPAFLHYRVVSGDTLLGVAAQYGVTVREIKLASNLTRDHLRPGEVLRVPLSRASEEHEVRLPPGVVIHTVKRGETLSQLERRYGVTRIELISANPGIPSLDRVGTGTELMVPTKQTGLILRLSEDRNLLDLASSYGIPLTTLTKANNLRDPLDASTGDFIMLPGVQASSEVNRLERKRAAERAEIARARAEAEAKRRAALEEARRQREAQAKIEAAQTAKREALRARQRASVVRVQRAAVYVRATPSGGFIWPMRAFTVTSGYGRRGFWIGGNNFHTGIDLAAPYGTPIYAAQSGTVIEAGWGYFGLNARVAIGDGAVTIYGHMSRLAVNSGEYVSRGELIGFIGCTGICTGPHLHFEVQVDGRPRNPLRYLP
jgi:murein DD-endopeptidase MepM/ murein hydrolase activator NlpD